MRKSAQVTLSGDRPPYGFGEVGREVFHGKRGMGREKLLHDLFVFLGLWGTGGID
jgi:hypothetical protein